MRLDKVYAYITHGERLLVFRQPDSPEAGIQVPGGSVEPGEPFLEAVMREAFEETGLDGLKVAAYLGEQTLRLTHPELGEMDHHRRFYHLTVDGSPPERWRHVEQTPSIGSVRPLFELFWVPLSAVPPLIAEMDHHLPALRRQFALAAGG